MLWGVGVDMLRIERMRGCLDSPSFLKSTFTPLEIDRADRRVDRSAYFAKVFAAKEAVFKCFGVPGDELDTWRSIEIAESPEAPPAVRLAGHMAELAVQRGISRVLLSLSSDADQVVAFAAALGEGSFVE